MPRGRRAGRGVIVAPATTATMIVFPFNNKTYKFNTSHYNPSMTNGLVSTEEINQFFDEMQVGISEYNKKDITNKWWLPLALFLCPVLIPIFIIYMCCCYVGDKDVKEKAINYIKEKAPSFKQRGFTWVATQIFPSWIELWTVEPPAYIQIHNAANTEKVNFAQAEMEMQNMRMMMMQQQQPQNMMMPNQQGGYMLNQQPNPNPNMMMNQQNQYSNNMYNGGVYSNNNNGISA